MLDFYVELIEEQKCPIVRVRGEIDIYTCPKLQKILNEAMQNAKRDDSNIIILNLEEVQYIDSTGLGTVAHTAKTLSTTGGKINIVCTRPHVKKVFDASGLSKKNISIFEEESLALSAV
ncbi:MAG: STAS domain-containing protein [Candidatus Margulisbacteria bacterium]|nr:STAS domain-containing protein [Candidatus Margulisiibacteriota bacterium]